MTKCSTSKGSGTAQVTLRRLYGFFRVRTSFGVMPPTLPCVSCSSSPRRTFLRICSPAHSDSTLGQRPRRFRRLQKGCPLEHRVSFLP